MADRLETGRMLKLAVGTVGRNFLPLIAVAAAFALPGVLLQLWSEEQSIGGVIATMALSTVANALMQGAVSDFIVRQLKGAQASLGDSLKVALGAFVPLVVTAILVGVGTALGMVLCLVPGFIFMTATVVSNSACVLEKLGPIDALKRSLALTKGHRWPMFITLLALGIVSLVVSVIVQQTLPASMAQNLKVVLSTLVLLPLSPVTGTWAALAYAELKTLKEGIDAEVVSKVFG